MTEGNPKAASLKLSSSLYSDVKYYNLLKILLNTVCNHHKSETTWTGYWKELGTQIETSSHDDKSV